MRAGKFEVCTWALENGCPPEWHKWDDEDEEEEEDDDDDEWEEEEEVEEEVEEDV